MSNCFTDLELVLLRLFHARLKQYGFPSAECIEFGSRKHTGVGCYTYVTHDGHIDIADAHIDHDYMIELDSLAAGADVWCTIENNKLRYLEIMAIGDDRWDGSETGWRLVNKQTGKRASLPE